MARCWLAGGFPLAGGIRDSSGAEPRGRPSRAFDAEPCLGPRSRSHVARNAGRHRRRVRFQRHLDAGVVAEIRDRKTFALTAPSRAAGSNRICSGRTMTSTGPSAPGRASANRPNAQSAKPADATPGSRTASPTNCASAASSRSPIQFLWRRDLRQHAVAQHCDFHAHRQRLGLIVRHQQRGRSRCRQRDRHGLSRLDRSAASSAENGSSSSTSFGRARARGPRRRVVARRPKAHAGHGRHRMRAGQRFPAGLPL